MTSTRRQFLAGLLGALAAVFTGHKPKHSHAAVRIADIRAFTVQSSWTWDGTKWNRTV